MNNSLRILHVSEVHWGGVVTLLREFTREQVAAGHEVHVLSPPLATMADGVGVESWTVERSKPHTFWAAARQLHRAVERHRPDVIHLHSFLAGFIARLPSVVAQRNRPGIVYQPHAWSFDLIRIPGASATVRVFERSALRRTDVIVGNCQDEVDEGVSAGIHLPAFVLGVAVRPEIYYPVDDLRRVGLRRQLGIKRPHLLVCIGRLAWQKGQDVLVSEWERAPLSESELVFVGPGDPSSLASLAPLEWNRSIRWVGEHADIRPWLWAADLLLLPSRYETVALVVAEALACGRPVIATAVNGAVATLLRGPSPPAGAVVPLGDMKRLLYEAGRRLLDPLLRQREGEAAWQRAQAEFSPEAVSARLEDAYRHAILLSRGLI